MAKLSKDSIDRFLDNDLWLEARTIYIGALPVHAVTELDSDEISPYTAAQVIKQLLVLDASSQDKPIKIILSSPGGCLYSGLAIFDAIKRCQSEVHILATGQCCSAASIILQAADKRQLSRSCIVMLHDGQDDVSGRPEDVSSWAKIGEQLNEIVYGIYAESSGKPKGYWRKKLKRDYILMPIKALEEGLADEVL